MQIGKSSEITYRRSVLKNICRKTEGVLQGIDAAAISLEDVTAVMSSNCILKWFDGAEDFYVQKTINCLWEKGATAEKMQLIIHLPCEFEEKSLGRMIRNFNRAAEKRNLAICQCKVYYGSVESPIANITVIGSTKHHLSCTNIKPGMEVIMAGTVGIGGTAILARKYKDILLAKFSNSFVEECLELENFISVEKAAQIAIDCEAVSMHNVSDGGIFGAVWELASCCNMGITINIPEIPVWQQVVEVTEVLDANPYLLEGTGAMLIVCTKGDKIVDRLMDAGIPAAVIGVMTGGNDRIAINKDETRYLEPPRGDELYKFIS